MKRYLLFAGSFYYPAGGWSDFLGDFDSVDEAHRSAPASDFDLLEVIDTKTMKDVDLPESGKQEME
jgi:hypothetical protein